VDYAIPFGLPVTCRTGQVRRLTCRRVPIGIAFTHGPILGFFRPAGATRCTDEGEIWQGGADLPNFTLIGSGMWVYGPQNLKNLGRVSRTILMKFAGFMRVRYLHNSFKNGCFTSINDKIMQNLPRWGHFSQIFDDP